jgi:hypothetical protein
LHEWALHSALQYKDRLRMTIVEQVAINLKLPKDLALRLHKAGMFNQEQLIKTLEAELERRERMSSFLNVSAWMNADPDEDDDQR